MNNDQPWFACINIRWKQFYALFKHLLWDLANVTAWRTLVDLNILNFKPVFVKSKFRSHHHLIVYEIVDMPSFTDSTGALMRMLHQERQDYGGVLWAKAMLWATKLLSWRSKLCDTAVHPEPQLPASGISTWEIAIAVTVKTNWMHCLIITCR